jgi:hypothetical protein
LLEPENGEREAPGESESEPRLNGEEPEPDEGRLLPEP